MLALCHSDPGARVRTEERLSRDGPDALLDAPGLFEALCAVRSLAMPSAPLFAYVAIRHALLAAGIDDRSLADYLAALLLEFGTHDRATHLGGGVADDQTYNYLLEIVSDLEEEASRGGPRAFELQAHLGNYSLWLAGLFPDFIAAVQRRRAGPDLAYYDAWGRRGYGLAAGHRLAAHYGVDGIYRQAAERFPALRQALNRLSDRMFFPAVQTDDKLLRSL